MQKKPCEKFLKLPQNRRFDEFSIFMNFIRGEPPHLWPKRESAWTTPTSVAKTESAGLHPHYGDLHVAPSRGTFIKAEFSASLGVKRSILMWIRLSRKKV